MIDTIGSWGVGGLAIVMAMGFVTAAILSTRVVSKIFKPIIEPNIDWLLPPEPKTEKA